MAAQTPAPPVPPRVVPVPAEVVADGLRLLVRGLGAKRVSP